MDITVGELIKILKSRLDKLKDPYLRPTEKGIYLRRVKNVLSQLEEQLAPKNEKDFKDFLEGMEK